MTWFAVDRNYGAHEVIACLFQLICVYARAGIGAPIFSLK